MSSDQHMVQMLSSRLREISRQADAFVIAVEVQDCGNDRAAAVGRAQALLHRRRKRDQVFDDLDLFGEPAWDILLDLFVMQHLHCNVSVNSACIAAAVAPTTALRHLARLEALGLVESTDDPMDRRRRFLRLSDTGLDMVSRALD